MHFHATRTARCSLHLQTLLLQRTRLVFDFDSALAQSPTGCSAAGQAARTDCNSPASYLCSCGV